MHLFLRHGSPSDKCKFDSAEPASGYAGAFRCLADGRGDVAFVKDDTVLANTGRIFYFVFLFRINMSSLLFLG